MSAYVVDATNPNAPTNSQGAAQGAEELRAIKALIQSLSNLNQAYVWRKNAIIGGDFDVNPWQRGTSFVSPSSQYTADRFYWAHNTTGVVTITQGAFNIPIATSQRRTNYGLDVQVTTADTSIAAGDYAQINHYIEGYNILPLAERALVLSFYTQHTKVGAYCVSLTNGVDKDIVAEYTQNVSNAIEKKTVTFVASGAGTWNFTTGLGLTVSWWLAAGTNFHGGSTSSWTTGNGRATVNQVNALDAVNNRFRLALTQLEVGSVATPFEFRTIQEELALCQRYYEKSYNQGVNPGTVTDVGKVGNYITALPNATYASALYVPFATKKRTTPTIVTYSPDTGTSGKLRDAATGADVNSTVDSAGVSGFRTYATQNAAATQVQLTGHWTASAEL